MWNLITDISNQINDTIMNSVWSYRIIFIQEYLETEMELA